jgi:hypothetical protein
MPLHPLSMCIHSRFVVFFLTLLATSISFSFFYLCFIISWRSFLKFVHESSLFKTLFIKFLFVRVSPILFSSSTRCVVHLGHLYSACSASSGSSLHSQHLLLLSLLILILYSLKIPWPVNNIIVK